MFRGYLHEDERYRKCFADNLYLTGDLAKRDGDGYYWFVGRADDVIKSSGHLIGPFEVENVLTEHPAVAEAGVIGKPDPTVGELVKAFVSLKDGFTADETLRRELLGHARKKLGAAVAPKEIEFVDALPHTRSGKIMRRLLKARELGLPEGDISTVETTRRASRPEGDAMTDPELARGLLSDMVRVRRMEEKCAELYSEAKIRGFLHLYVGEEAVAAGSLRALDGRRRGGGHLSRARARAAARHPDDLDHGGDVRQDRKAVRAAGAAPCTCSTRPPGSTAATRSLPAVCRWRSARPSPT